MSKHGQSPQPGADIATPEQVLTQANIAAAISRAHIRDIHTITHQCNILAINARIEAARAGQVGLGFAIIATELGALSAAVARIASEMDGELSTAFETLRRIGARMADEIRGQRLIDLALNAIEIMDRNLYERTCDVRWWATDAAIVDATGRAEPDKRAYAGARLGVILRAYTVYLDLWLCNTDGKVIAHGRPDRYPGAAGTDVSREAWFIDAMAGKSGDDFAVANVALCRVLGNAPVATYAAAVRAGGAADGRIQGVLGIHFDWGAQAEAVVKGVRLNADELTRTRVLLLDAAGCVIAASDRPCLLDEFISLEDRGRDSGSYRDGSGRTIAFHRTPGYETYLGLGWYGVLIQEA
jgi:hypothetical protein